LRARLGNRIAKSEVKQELDDKAKRALSELDTAFKSSALPDKLDLAVTGAQGIAITALIGLTADADGVQLPLASWGAGTRRLAALAIAEKTRVTARSPLLMKSKRVWNPIGSALLSISCRPARHRSS